MSSQEPLIPAAEYLRMSTDDQPNSIPLQKVAIRRYAVAHGYEVIASYADEGKSGLEIKHRPCLRQLIKDVLESAVNFRAILVYDVSRWGRFQDTDESAHYEFMCRSMGVTVHYCAEQFQNDGTMSNAIMKALKRTMAAEYSRELSVKVAAGMRRVVTQGYRVGSSAGYGLRRMMVSPNGQKKRILKLGEHKYATTDRVILVPGASREVEIIREIFAMAANERKSPFQIAEALNKRGLRFSNGNPWNDSTVYRLLKNEKYMGSNVYGKKVCFLNTFMRRTPPSDWTIKPNAFVPLVAPGQFTKVQHLLKTRKTYRRPDEYLLNRMRRVWAREGKLTEKLLVKYGYFDYRRYVERFGSVKHAYEMIGYKPSSHAFASIEGFAKMKQLRSQLLASVANSSPSRIKIVKLSGQQQRQVLQVDNNLHVAVHICRPLRPSASVARRWLLTGQSKEENLLALVCLADETMTRLTDFFVVPAFGKLINRYKVLSQNHPWLKAGRRLNSLSEVCDVAKEIATNWTVDKGTRVFGDVILNERISTIIIAGRAFNLPGVEAALLKWLVKNSGRTISREKLCEAALFASREKTTPLRDPRKTFLTNHMSVLRRKIRPFHKRIVTVKNKGYEYAIEGQSKSFRGEEYSHTLRRLEQMGKSQWKLRSN